MQTIRLDVLQLQPHHRVLDLGCGKGRHALAVYWFGAAQQVVAVDIDRHDLAVAISRKGDFPQPDPEKSCDFLRADGLQLPFADATFDVVICSEVLEHIGPYEKMLGEIHRVCKSGGRLAVSVPREWPERICWWLSREYHQVQGGHIRIFNAGVLRRQIAVRRFDFYLRHWAHALHVPYWWLRCLFWKRGADFAPVSCYHRLLVWDLLKKPRLTQMLDTLLNPLMGKSVVLYFTKEQD
jgi:SAM-dependent methyltransferase